MELGRNRLSPGSSAWVVAGITLLALVLRLYRIDAQSFWVDEVVTWKAAGLPITEMLTAGTYYARAHILYYAIMHGIVLVSDSEIAMRLPSALLGALSVPLLFMVGERWMDRGIGIAAAALLAISPLHLYYGQEARPYAALVFFVLLALVCLERALRRPGNAGWQAGFVAASLAGILCHPVGLAVVPVYVLYAVLPGHRAGLRRVWPSFAILFLAVLALVAVYLTLPSVSSRRTDSEGLLALAYTGWTFAVGYSLGPSVRELHLPGRVDAVLAYAPMVVLGLVVFGGLLIAGALSTWRRSPGIAVCVAGWLALPVMFVILGTGVTGQPFNVRYALPALPPFLLLAGSGIRALPPGLARGAAWALVVVLTAASIVNYHRDPRYQREDYRAAVSALRQAADPGDLVLVSVDYSRIVLDYYDPGPVEVATLTGPAARGHGKPARVGSGDWRAEVDRLVGGRGRIWVLLSRTFDDPAEGQLLPYLDRRYQRERERAWAGIRLIGYTARTTLHDPAARAYL